MCSDIVHATGRSAREMCSDTVDEMLVGNLGPWMGQPAPAFLESGRSWFRFAHNCPMPLLAQFVCPPAVKVGISQAGVLAGSLSRWSAQTPNDQRSVSQSSAHGLSCAILGGTSVPSGRRCGDVPGEAM